MPPPGDGFASVRLNVPAVERSFWVRATVRVLFALSDVARGLPLTAALVDARNPEPATMMFPPGLPAGNPFGSRLWMRGFGLLPAGATTGSRNRSDAAL